MQNTLLKTRLNELTSPVDQTRGAADEAGSIVNANDMNPGVYNDATISAAMWENVMDEQTGRSLVLAQKIDLGFKAEFAEEDRKLRLTSKKRGGGVVAEGGTEGFNSSPTGHAATCGTKAMSNTKRSYG
jgi:hypothetical protein